MPIGARLPAPNTVAAVSRDTYKQFFDAQTRHGGGPLSSRRKHGKRPCPRSCRAVGQHRHLPVVRSNPRCARRRVTRLHERAEASAPLSPGLEFPRYFTLPGVDPFDEVEWEIRSAVIGNEKGKVVFEQRDVEIPKFWSQQATNIVVSKYFRGQIGTPERERSVKQLIGRVVDTITIWARAQKYFASEEALQSFSAELKHLLVYQKAAFNSPVWFNCGFEKAPQCSACFINSVQDTMDSILTLARTEGMLFKFGSGTGSNLSVDPLVAASCSPAAAPRPARCRS